MNAAVQCVYCDRFTLRDNAKFAAVGLGRCALMADRPGTFVSPLYRWACGEFQPALEAKATARIEWLRDLRSEGA